MNLESVKRVFVVMGVAKTPSKREVEVGGRYRPTRPSADECREENGGLDPALRAEMEGGTRTDGGMKYNSLFCILWECVSVWSHLHT